MSKILYTVIEASDVLLCNKTRVYNLVRDGKIPCIRELGRIKILHSELMKYLESISSTYKNA